MTAAPNTVDMKAIRAAGEVKLAPPVLVDTAEFRRAAYLAALNGLCAKLPELPSDRLVATAVRLADASVDAMFRPKEPCHGRPR